jgi:hypothetical protein
MLHQKPERVQGTSNDYLGHENINHQTRIYAYSQTIHINTLSLAGYWDFAGLYPGVGWLGARGEHSSAIANSVGGIPNAYTGAANAAAT